MWNWGSKCKLSHFLNYLKFKKKSAFRRLESHACAESVECSKNGQKCWLAWKPYAQLTQFESFKVEMLHGSMASLSCCWPLPTKLAAQPSQPMRSNSQGWIVLPSQGEGRSHALQTKQNAKETAMKTTSSGWNPSNESKNRHGETNAGTLAPTVRLRVPCNH